MPKPISPSRSITPGDSSPGAIGRSASLRSSPSVRRLNSTSTPSSAALAVRPSVSSALTHGTLRASRVSGSEAMIAPMSAYTRARPLSGRPSRPCSKVSASRCSSPSARSSDSVKELLGAREDHHVVLDGEHGAVVLVDGRAGLLALLGRPRLVDQAVERVRVLHLDGGHEVVVLRVVGEGGHVRRADHERVPEQRLHVLLEVDVLLAAGKLLREHLLHRLDAQRELGEQGVDRLDLVALEVGVDRDGERGLRGHVGQRLVERPGRVVVALPHSPRRRARRALRCRARMRRGRRTAGECSFRAGPRATVVSGRARRPG